MSRAEPGRLRSDWPDQAVSDRRGSSWIGSGEYKMGIKFASILATGAPKADSCGMPGGAVREFAPLVWAIHRTVCWDVTILSKIRTEYPPASRPQTRPSPDSSSGRRPSDLRRVDELHRAHVKTPGVAVSTGGQEARRRNDQPTVGFSACRTALVWPSLGARAQSRLSRGFHSGASGRAWRRSSALWHLARSVLCSCRLASQLLLASPSTFG